jgi:hypothetical protein
MEAIRSRNAWEEGFEGRPVMTFSGLKDRLKLPEYSLIDNGRDSTRLSHEHNLGNLPLHQLVHLFYCAESFSWDYSVRTTAIRSWAPPSLEFVCRHQHKKIKYDSSKDGRVTRQDGKLHALHGTSLPLWLVSRAGPLNTRRKCCPMLVDKSFEGSRCWVWTESTPRP